MEQYRVTGMSCAACSARVEKAVSKVPGVTSCVVNLLTNSMGVEGTAPPSAIVAAVEQAGYGAVLKGNRPAGTGTFDGSAGDPTGSGLSGSSGTAYAVEEDAIRDGETSALRRRLIWSLGFLLLLMYLSMGHMLFGWPLPPLLEGNPVGTGLAELLLAAIVMVTNQKFFVNGFKSLWYRAPNMDALVATGSAAAFLYSVCALFAMTAAQARGDAAAVSGWMREFYFESAAMILTLITVGKMLEARAKGKTMDALKSLTQLAPRTASVIREGTERRIPVEQVRTGDIFLVRPGEAIPVDGTVEDGSGAVDEAALTGESIPVDKERGDSVSTGTINQSGFLRCRAVRIGADTTLARIIQMVSDAAATKAPIAKLADRVSGVFVPAVMGIAAVTTVIWLLLGQSMGFALGRGISVLVISCPCALGLATPVAIMVGSGVGAKNGILFKTAASLEAAGRTEIIALDKTGTITRGEPHITGVFPEAEVSEMELLSLAAAMEQGSEHPLAKAVVHLAEERHLPLPETAEFHALPGNGVTAILSPLQNGNRTAGDSTAYNENHTAGDSTAHSGNRTVGDSTAGGGTDAHSAPASGRLAGGSLAFLRTQAEIPARAQSHAEELAEAGNTPLFFSRDGKLLGILSVADVIKEDSPRAVEELRNLGLRVVMLTGDNARTARAVGEKAGADEVIAGVLPDGKDREIRRLRALGRTAMVGDGINDAPALVRADTGIAIGAGTDVAIDAADVVLMKSRLTDVPAAIRLSRATLRNIRQNLFWAFFYNVIGIPLAAGALIPFGLTLNPMFGAAAMSMSSFCVVSNALRLNLLDIRDSSRDRPLKRGKKIPGYPRRTGGGNPVERDGTESDHHQEESNMKKTLKVEGMMCAHCESRVKKALEALDQVEQAEVSHESGTAVVTLSAPAEDAVLRKAVEDQDYRVISVV